jgi:alkaline phosphatase D
MNRREFLRVLGGAGLTGSALLGKSGCAPALIRSDADSGLSLGYLAGEVTHESALIWLRAEPRSEVALQYSTDPGFRQFSLTGQFAVRADTDFTAKISLDKLQAATRYYYRAAVAGKAPGQIASFVTAPRPDDEAKVTFCFSGDTRESYKPFTAMNAVRAQQPDFFLHLGDTIYADRSGSARRLEEFWSKYRINRDDAATQNCFSNTSVYVVWDDHEVEDNYLPGHPLAPIGRRAFLDYWPIRCPSTEPERIFRSFRWGRSAELFILDARQYRDPKHGKMLGKVQKEWLFDRLASSEAIFKFVATTVPMAGGGSDRWDGYPKEREDLLRYIIDRKIRGVVFLSADMHYAAITKIPKGRGLKDITAGPIAAQLNRITNGTASRFEYFLAENFNFAKITVDPQTDPSHASVEFIDQDNRVFHSAKITAGRSL